MGNDNYKFLVDAMRQTRQNMIKIINAHSIAEINKITDGFNNNLVWNFVHVIVTQQLLCYSLSGLKPVIDSDIINAYRKGSKPDGDIDKRMLEQYLNMATDTLDQFVTDLKENIFTDYKLYESSFGISLSSIDDAMQFNLAHETLHLGTMMALRKLI